ncbi:MAG: glycyl radical protein [Actinobacteria bacterium]|nr:glycyl radical protein [Actinomycetota bacterium]
MAEQARAIEYRGKIIEFPFENPQEKDIPIEHLHERISKLSTERTKRIKARLRWKHTAVGDFVEEGIRAGIERMRYYTEAYKASEGQPEVIRRALSVANVLSKGTIFVQEDEFIVGYHAEHPNWVPQYPELSPFTVMDYMQSKYSPQPVEEAAEIVQFWAKNSLMAHAQHYYTQDELLRQFSITAMEAPAFASGFNSIIPPYETVLEDGLLKRIELAEAHIKDAIEQLAAPYWVADDRLPLIGKVDVWRSMVIIDKAVIAWARRYARLCKIMAENFEADPSRKEELLEMAEINYRIPAEPCKGLKDGMQAKWYTYLMCHAIERYASGYAHKEDKLLWPLYKASVIDKAFQPMTHEQAIELFELERFKVSEHGAGKGRFYREVFPGSNDLFILAIGGTNGDNSDGCNDCTDAILQAAINARTPEPSIVFRWHPKGRLKTKRLVFECIRDGMGFPSIMHDVIGTNQLIYLSQFSKTGNGVTPEEAHDWANVLCMSPGHVGRRKSQKTRTEGAGTVFVAKLFEVTLSGGFDWSYSGIQVGLETPKLTELKTFEDLWEAFRQQYQYAASMVNRGKDVSRYFEIRYMQMPFVSSIDDGCMELGIDANELSEQPNPWTNSIGNMVAANSLVAMKKLIYDDKKYTLEQLEEALHSNWAGFEEMHKDFLNAPKFGNDDPYADEIVKRYYEDIVAGEMKHIYNYSGGMMMPVGQAVGANVEIGARTGPTPDGRFGGEAHDDGGISPYYGTDKKGPTAVLRSVSKINSEGQKSNLLNQRLSQPMMRSVHGFKIWLAYMNTWFDLDIDHVQFNVVSTEEMRAAQKEPEKHGDLIVRVAGYSARFIDVNTYQQNTIISRTEQDFGTEDLDYLGVDL